MKQGGGFFIPLGAAFRCMDNYQELPALFARAGVSWQETTVPDDGRYLIWEDRGQRVHEGYSYRFGHHRKFERDGVKAVRIVRPP